MPDRVLVCGGRDFNDSVWLSRVLDGYHANHVIKLVIHGGAQGADKLAGRWAYTNKVSVRMFNANWRRYGKLAGFLRNRRMLEEGKPDVILAFPGGRGTANMIKLGEEAGLTVFTMQASPEDLFDA